MFCIISKSSPDHQIKTLAKISRLAYMVQNICSRDRHTHTQLSSLGLSGIRILLFVYNKYKLLFHPMLLFENILMLNQITETHCCMLNLCYICVHVLWAYRFLRAALMICQRALDLFTVSRAYPWQCSISPSFIQQVVWCWHTESEGFGEIRMHALEWDSIGTEFWSPWSCIILLI